MQFKNMLNGCVVWEMALQPHDLIINWYLLFTFEIEPLIMAVYTETYDIFWIIYHLVVSVLGIG